MLQSHWYSKLPLAMLLASSALVMLVALLRHADAQIGTQVDAKTPGVEPGTSRAGTSESGDAVETMADAPTAIVPPSVVTGEEAPSLTVPVPELKPSTPLSPEALARDPLFQEMRKLLKQTDGEFHVPPVEVNSPLEPVQPTDSSAPSLPLLGSSAMAPAALDLKRMESVQHLADTSIQLLQEAQILESVGQSAAAAELKTMAQQLRAMIARLAR